MQKFKQLLQSSSKEIKENRATILAEESSDAMEDILRDKRKVVRDIEKKLLSLSDLHRDSELSLRIVKDNFNPKQWLMEMHSTKLDLLEAKIELSVAEELYNTWFKDEKKK